MTSGCSKCCRDIDIDPLDLFFPERMDARGREFMEAHGLFDDLSLDGIADSSIVLPNGMLKVFHVCRQLDLDTQLCIIYDDRPSICRDYQCDVRTGDDACTQTPKVLTFMKRTE